MTATQLTRIATPPRLSIIPAAAIADRRLLDSDLRVLVFLGSRIDAAGVCRLSRPVIAQKLGKSLSTVRRAFSRLTAAGYVEIRPRDGARGPCPCRVVISAPASTQAEAA